MQTHETCPKCGVKSFIADANGEVHVNGCNCSLHIAMAELARLTSEIASVKEQASQALIIAADQKRSAIEKIAARAESAEAERDELRAKLAAIEAGSFAATCDRVCRDLPEGWGIVIELEKDSGVIVLEDTNAEGVDFPTNNEKFEQTLEDALQYAIEQAALHHTP